MSGRSKKREERKRRLEEEEVSRRIREQAERQKELFFLEQDPIKQYVRHFGWLQIVQDYVQRRRDDGVNRPLRYLTLPGPSATDVGVLWRAGLLARTDEGFPDLVICDEKFADEALMVLGTVDGVSRQSLIHAVKEDLVPYFPFDVINLDMYGAVVTGSPLRRRALRTLRAIRQIIHLQRGQSFLFLLTCSTDESSAHTYLEECLLGNFNEDDFRKAYLERYGELDSNPFQNDYRTFVGLVLPKAIGRMARKRGYKTVERFAAKYNRKGHHILCHSFELEHLGRRKPEKKYEACFENVEWDELNEELSGSTRDLANRAYLEFIPTLVQRDLLDVEDILRSNPDLGIRMKQEAKSYIGWEERNEPA